MKQILLRLLSLTTILLLAGTILGFDPDHDHPAMTQYAIDNSSISDFLRDNLRITSASTFSIPFSIGVKKNYLGLLKEGSRIADYEGNGDFDHYFDPTTQSGLNDGNHSGQSSLLLARQYWQEAYDAYEDALTELQLGSRDQEFGTLFLNLGRILHLLQDLGDPAHTRNDGPLEAGTLNLTESGMAYWFDYYYQIEELELPEIPSDISQLERYWYNDNPEYYPFPGAPICDSPGLADLSHNTFFSENTLPDTCSYEFPPTDSSSYTAPCLPNYRCYEDPCLEESNPDYAINELYYETSFHQQCVSAGVCPPVFDCNNGVFDADLRLGSEAYWDTQFHMASYIVAYSAGLLDHFFQGELKVTIAPSTTPDYYDVTVRNVSGGGADLIEGTLSFYWQKNDTREVFEIEGSMEENVTILNGVPMIFSVPAIPEELLEGQEIADTLYTVVYRGKVGTDYGMDFIGEQDAVIGKKVYPDVDRGRIFYVAVEGTTGFRSIRSIRHDGSEKQIHYSCVSAYSCDIKGANLSPDGKWVLFSEEVMQSETTRTFSLQMLNTETDQVTVIGSYINDTSATIPPFSWNSDSTEAVIALIDPVEESSTDYLSIVDVSGGIRHVVNSSSWSSEIWATSATFNHDDTEIYFDAVRRYGEPPISEQAHSVWSVPVAGGQVTRISEEAYVGEGTNVYAVTSNPWTENSLYAAQYGTGMTELFEKGRNPDGVYEVYALFEEPNPFHPVRSITSSPDKKYLSWMVNDSGQTSYSILPEDSEMFLGTGISGFHYTPYWSPTSQRLAYLEDGISRADRHAIQVVSISSDHTSPPAYSFTEDIDFLVGWGGDNAEKELTIIQPAEGDVFYKVGNPDIPIDIVFSYADADMPTNGQFVPSLVQGSGTFTPVILEGDLLGNCKLTPTVPGTYEIKIEYVPNGKAEGDPIFDVQRILVEKYYTITMEPSPTSSEDFRKILISTRIGDDAYPSPYQDTDGFITIIARIDPPDYNIPVYFLVQDPDDPSVYEEDESGLDNYGNHSIPASARTSDNGVAIVELQITDRHAGDNYEVYGFIQRIDGNTLAVGQTGTLAAWKRIYVETDRMFRKGSAIREEVVVGQNFVKVWNISAFGIGDRVRIFDVDNQDEPFGETKIISDIDYFWNYLYFDSPCNDNYNANGDPIYFPTRSYIGLVIDFDNLNHSTFFETDYSRAMQLFDPAYVEFSFLSKGSGPIPNPEWSTEQYAQDLDNFSLDWWHADHYGHANQLHLIGAKENPNSGLFAGTLFRRGTSYVFVNEIEEYPSEDVASTTLHELSHNFSREVVNDCDQESPPTCYICDNEAFKPPFGGELCVMNWYRDKSNNVDRFCLEHILIADDNLTGESIDESIRRQVNAIGRLP